MKQLLQRIGCCRSRSRCRRFVLFYTHFRTGKWFVMRSIWLERAINWNGWHLLNGQIENIVANIDDQIVLFTFYALNSRQFCELTVQHRKYMESHMHTHCANDRGCRRLLSPPFTVPFLHLRKMLEIRIFVLYSMSMGCWRAMNKTTTVACLRFCRIDGYVRCSFLWWLAKTKQRLIIFLMA